MAMERNERPEVRAGMAAVGSDGGVIGTISEARDEDFLVERPLARDVYVPYEAVRAVVAGLVQLDVRSDEVNQMPWRHP